MYSPTKVRLAKSYFKFSKSFFLNSEIYVNQHLANITAKLNRIAFLFSYFYMSSTFLTIIPTFLEAIDQASRAGM